MASRCELEILRESWPIRGSFTISRGSKTQADVIVCRISQEGRAGRGECVPYGRYGETIESVEAQLGEFRVLVEGGASRETLRHEMPAGAARNALDCALWDLEAKQTGVRVHSRVCRFPPRPIPTAMTISLGYPETMAASARANSHRPLLKVKLGGMGDEDRIRAVAGAAPATRIILDANEAWSAENIHDLMMVSAEMRIALIEQPLPAGKDALLREIPHPVPICADESAHVTADLDGLRDCYDAVNIKLDKAGGLSEALEMRNRAHELGFSVMVGCMVSTSLAMAPALLLAQQAEFVDLDGPLILDRDRADGLSYSTSLVSPPSPRLWG
ncbi:MAG: N-acetyl-D-Glu racemase DgcA [Rhizobiaceae bacterium]